MNTLPTVLIIGGTSGIGFATAMRFSIDHNIIIIGRDSRKGLLAEKQISNSLFIPCDISILKQRKILLEKVKNNNISKIVHCAGIFSENGLGNYQHDYKAVKLGAIKFINNLIDIHSVTHVCAVSSIYTILPDAVVPVFEKSVQKDVESKMFLLPKNIIVNCVAPSLTNTPLTQKEFGEKKIARFLNLAPGSRIVEPEEVAETVYWLSNQQTINRYVIPIDGGFLRSFNEMIKK